MQYDRDNEVKQLPQTENSRIESVRDNSSLSLLEESAVTSGRLQLD